MLTTLTHSDALRGALKPLRASKRIAFVPTMGNLHAGHISLVEHARSIADIVVVSIYINPLQFGANEDLDSYPRTLSADQEKLLDAGADFLYTPKSDDIYPDGMPAHTTVSVPQLTSRLCGAARPGHFDGVSTIVSKLFNIVQPDIAIFGQKDFQQLAVIRKMVRDLLIPVEIEGIATGRAPDGLALSSRNGYLSESERSTAPLLYQCLLGCVENIKSGEKNYQKLEQNAIIQLKSEGFMPNYFEICDANSLEPAQDSTESLVLLVAATLGNTRLIDNVTLELNA